MLIIQLILTYLLLNTEIGLILIRIISSLFTKLLEYAADGINFVFGGLANKGEMPFFPYCIITNRLYFCFNWYITTFQNITIFFIRWIGYFLSKINGLGKLESYNAIASAIVGQSEVFITVKKTISSNSKTPSLYTLCLCYVNRIYVYRRCLYDND